MLKTDTNNTHPKTLLFQEIAAELISTLKPLKFSSKTVLLRQGQESDAAYFVTSGSLSVYAETPYGPVALSTISAPCLVGEIGAITHLRRIASIETDTETEAYKIDRNQLIALGREKPDILLSIIEQLSQNIRSVNESLALYTNALSALERRDFDSAILEDLAHPSPQLAPFAAAFKRFAEQIFFKRRQQDEVANAALIQKSFLPLSPMMDIPDFGVRVRAEIRPARDVSGDFYDYFFVHKDKLAIVIGDVCGKGMPASLYMSAVVTVIRMLAKESVEPAQIMSRANILLSRDNAANMFATAFYGVLDLKSGVFDYCSCGHPAPVIISQNGSYRRLKGGGLALAICEDAKINNNQTELISGDRLVIFTDGLSEALNSKESEFGESRIVQSLCQHQAADPNEFLKLLFSDVDAFVQEAEQADDMTAIALMRL